MTFARGNDIIMAQFDESKHPRDNDGKFTDGNGFSYSDNGDKLLKAVNEYTKSDKSKLTSQEWAVWYKAVAENKKLGYWAEELPNGDALLRVENNNAHKLVITSGTFEEPKAKAIFEFDNSDDLIDFVEKLKEST